MKNSDNTDNRFAKFSIKDFEKELNTELKMREKVWVKGRDTKFRDPIQDRRFAILQELLTILEFAPWSCFEEMRQKAESAATVVQVSMFTEDI